MDLALTQEQQQALYQFSLDVYQFSNLALSNIDLVDMYIFGKAIGKLKNAPSLYDDIATNVSDDVASTTNKTAVQMNLQFFVEDGTKT